jgi:hypothetical protein
MPGDCSCGWACLWRSTYQLQRRVGIANTGPGLSAHQRWGVQARPPKAANWRSARLKTCAVLCRDKEAAHTPAGSTLAYSREIWCALRRGGARAARGRCFGSDPAEPHCCDTHSSLLLPANPPRSLRTGTRLCKHRSARAYSHSHRGSPASFSQGPIPSLNTAPPVLLNTIRSDMPQPMHHRPTYLIQCMPKSTLKLTHAHTLAQRISTGQTPHGGGRAVSVALNSPYSTHAAAPVQRCIRIPYLRTDPMRRTLESLAGLCHYYSRFITFRIKHLTSFLRRESANLLVLSSTVVLISKQ